MCGYERELLCGYYPKELMPSNSSSLSSSNLEKRGVCDTNDRMLGIATCFGSPIGSDENMGIAGPSRISLKSISAHAEFLFLFNVLLNDTLSCYALPS